MESGPSQEERKRLEDVARMKEWVTLKLKELEDQNTHLAAENRKFSEELVRLKQCYGSNSNNIDSIHNSNASNNSGNNISRKLGTVNNSKQKCYTPEVRRKHSGRHRDRSRDKDRGIHQRLRKFTSREQIIDSSSSSDEDDEEWTQRFHHRFHNNHKRNSKQGKSPGIEGNNITLLSGAQRQLPCAGSSSRAGSLDRKLSRMKKYNFHELKNQQNQPHYHHQQLNHQSPQNSVEYTDLLTKNPVPEPEDNIYDAVSQTQNQQEFCGNSTQNHHYHNFHSIQNRQSESKPPTPPAHRCPSWETRIYEIARQGIQSAITTPVSSVNKRFELQPPPLPSDPPGSVHHNPQLPIFRNMNGRLTKIRINSVDDQSLSEFDAMGVLKSTTTSSGNESDFTTEFSRYLPETCAQDSDSSEDDYAYPPDALANAMDSLHISNHLNDNIARNRTLTNASSTANNASTNSTTNKAQNISEYKLEKAGYLLKIGGKFRHWKRRWFVLKNGILYYYKCHEDYVRNRAKEQIELNASCRIAKRKDCVFDLIYKDGKKHLQLCADSIESYNEWVQILGQTLTHNSIFKLREQQEPIIANYLIKVRLGQSVRCWAALYGQFLVYFSSSDERVPLGFTHLKDSKIQQLNSVDYIEDNLFQDGKRLINNSISIHTSDNSEPVYLMFYSKQEFSVWQYQLTLVVTDGHVQKTVFENFLNILADVESNSSSPEDFYRHPVWNNSVIVHSEEPLSEPLTSLPTDFLKNEALSMFKSLQLFTSVPIEGAAIDYHVSLVQNSLKTCLQHPELQCELFCQLIKQGTPESRCKDLLSSKGNTFQKMLQSCQFVPKCEVGQSSQDSSEKESPSTSPTTNNDDNWRKLSTILLQSFQFLSVAVSIFEPKKQILWLLKHHLGRWKDSGTDLGQYASYCERALSRCVSSGPRRQSPSRMEVLSILQRNPFKHSAPHSIPVHFPNGTYQVVGFDGSSSVGEFVATINAESGIRDNLLSGFALYSDDPLSNDVEHLLNLHCKLADIVSQWEENLRKFQLGKFENTRAIRLMYKHRLCLRKHYKNETDRERLLWVYEIAQDIVQNKFPISFDLTVELASLLIQLQFGDMKNIDNHEPAFERIRQLTIPAKYQAVSTVKERIMQAWFELDGRSPLDCVRIFLNCTRRWRLCGSRLFHAKVSNLFKYDDMVSLQLCKFFSQHSNVWITLTETTIELLDFDTFRPILCIPQAGVINFGGFKHQFMVVVHANIIEKFTDAEYSVPFTELKNLQVQRLLFDMSKRSIVAITMMLADYINLSTLPERK